MLLFIRDCTYKICRGSGCRKQMKKGFSWPSLHMQSIRISRVSLQGSFFKWNFMSRTLNRLENRKMLIYFPFHEARFTGIFIWLRCHFYRKEAKRIKKKKNTTLLKAHCIAQYNVEIQVWSYSCVCQWSCFRKNERTRECSKLYFEIIFILIEMLSLRF